MEDGIKPCTMRNYIQIIIIVLCIVFKALGVQ